MLTQADVAHIDDDTLRRLAAMYWQMHEAGGPFAAFARVFALEFVRVRRERTRDLLVLEADVMNHNGPGLFLGDSL